MEPSKLYHGKGLSESIQLPHEMTSEFHQPLRNKQNHVSLLVGIELLRGSCDINRRTWIKRGKIRKPIETRLLKNDSITKP
jgi:hypothetical protein